MSVEWALPRPLRWLLDRGWDWMSRKLVPVDDSLADIGDAFTEEDVAA